MLIACTLTTGAARTAEAPCPLEPIGSGSVVSVVDGRSFLLDDGREVRLAGLQIPAPARAGDKDDSVGRAAKAALESLLAGQVVTLKAPKPASDRYGRIVAYAFVGGAESPSSIAFCCKGRPWLPPGRTIAPAVPSFSRARKRRARPSLAFGPIRFMACAARRAERRCSRREAISP